MTRHAARTAAMPPPLWAALPAPRATLDAVVVVPVRSEAARLPATLAALAAQIDDDGRPLPPDRYEIIVLANNCTDASAQIVRRFAARHRLLNVHVVEVTFAEAQANVGHARACLMDEACRRLHAVGRLDGAIANTDGDTCVAADWLAATLREMRRGADAVGGRIDMNDDDQPLPAGLERMARRDADYQRLRNRLEHVLDPNPADPWPRHHQHFGASLAITVAAYLQVGGLPAAPFLEDEALCQALLAHDLKLRHSDSVRVVTSNRRRGRVAVGLSWQLREWSAMASSDADADPEVDDPVRLAHEFRLRRRLRVCWAACHGEGDGRGDGGMASVSDSDSVAVAVDVFGAGGAGDAGDAVNAVDAIELTELADGLQLPADWLMARVRDGTTFGQLWLAVTAQRQSALGAAAQSRVPMREAIEVLRAILAVAPDGDGLGTHFANDALAAPALSGARGGRADTALGASRSHG